MSVAAYLPPSEDVPEWASDTNYPAGADPWSATATKVTPSSGQIADGFVPDTEPPAQWFNWFWNLIGRHTSSLRGVQVLNFQPGFQLNGYVTAGTQKTQACAILDSNSRPVVCVFGADAKTRRMWNEAQCSVSDADSTTTVGTALAGGQFSGSPTLVRNVNGSGNVRKSTDLGMTWSAAGALGVTPTVRLLHYFAAASRWIYFHDQADRAHYTPDLSTWTAVTGAGAAPTTPHDIDSNTNACIAVFTGSQTVCARSSDGITWTLPTLSAGGHDWRGVAYNSVRSTWMVVASDGVASRSLNNGLAWTEITVPTGALDVAAFGRFFVAVGVRSGYGGFIAVSEDLGDTWSEYFISPDTFGSAWDRLMIFDGRLAACGRDANLKPQLALSLRAPWMPVPGDV